MNKLTPKSKEAVQLEQQLLQGMQESAKFGAPCRRDGIRDDVSKLIPLIALQHLVRFRFSNGFREEAVEGRPHLVQLAYPGTKPEVPKAYLKKRPKVEASATGATANCSAFEFPTLKKANVL